MNLKRLLSKKRKVTKPLTKEQLLKQNKLLKIVYVCFIILLFSVSGVLYWVFLSPMEPVAHCMMYYPKTFGEFPSGIYLSDKYYCIWTKDRSDDYLYYVDYHEMCHNLVFWDRQHFCGSKEGSNGLYPLYNWTAIRWGNYTKEINKYNITGVERI